MLSFETEVNIEDETRNCYGKTTIKWNIELEARGWGIKGIWASVPEQEIFSWIKVRADDDIEEIRTSYILDNVKVENVVSGEYGFICPQTLIVTKDNKFILDFE